MTDNVIALKSGIWYTVSSFLFKSITFISTPLFTRIISLDEYGMYSNYQSWFMILTIIISLNLEATFISAKYDYSNSINDYIDSIISLSVCSGIIWIMGYTISYSYLDAYLNIPTLLMYLMIIQIIGNSIINIFQTKCLYEFNYKKNIMISGFNTISTASISVILVVLMNDKVLGRVLGSLIPALLIVIYFFFLKKEFNLSFNIHHWQYALPISIPYIPHLLSLLILNCIDRIMIHDIYGPSDTALYSLAYNCACILIVFMTAVNSAFCPWLSNKMHRKEYKDICKITTYYIIAFSYIVFGFLLIAPEILLLFGGEKYGQSLNVIPIVSVGCFFQFLYTFYVNVEQFLKKTTFMAVATITAAVLNIVLNLYFIPLYGYIAAAYTTLICYFWLLLVHYFLIRIIVHNHLFNQKIFFLLAVSFASFAALFCKIYIFDTIRYILISVYFLIGLGLALKYNKVIKDIFKN